MQSQSVPAQLPAGGRLLLDMNGYQWTALFAAWLGWGFDVFDGLLFNYVAPNCVPSLLGLGAWIGKRVYEYVKAPKDAPTDLPAADGVKAVTDKIPDIAKVGALDGEGLDIELPAGTLDPIATVVVLNTK